ALARVPQCQRVLGPAGGDPLAVGRERGGLKLRACKQLDGGLERGSVGAPGLELGLERGLLGAACAQGQAQQQRDGQASLQHDGLRYRWSSSHWTMSLMKAGSTRRSSKYIFISEGLPLQGLNRWSRSA